MKGDWCGYRAGSSNRFQLCKSTADSRSQASTTEILISRSRITVNPLKQASQKLMAYFTRPVASFEDTLLRYDLIPWKVGAGNGYLKNRD